MYACLTRLAFPDLWRVYRNRYWRSKKGQTRYTRYSKTAIFKATQRRYAQSPNGRVKKLAACRRHQTLKRKARQGCPLLIEKIYKRAQELRKWFDVEVDHIVPLSKGGAHTSKNLQIIYGFENASKQANPNYKPKVIFK